MWRCRKCHEKVDDEFQACWNCGTSDDGTEDPNFRHADRIRPEELKPAGTLPDIDISTAIQAENPNRPPLVPSPSGPVVSIRCLRCDGEAEFLGTKSFHEGFQWGGLLGALGDFLVNQVSFDVYACKRCGRVEFFVTGVGEQFRAPKDPRNG
jgi:hypothetical protein